MSKDITPAQAKKAGEELAQLARKAPRPPSPLLRAVKELVPRDRYGVLYTTHYQEGGMRCKLYGASMRHMPRGLKSGLAKMGFKNITIIDGADPSHGYRHPSVTILASLGDQRVSPRSPVMRAKKASAAQQLGEIPLKPKTIYDQRSSVDERVRAAAPLLYRALKNLTDAVTEQQVLASSIESVVLSDARAALLQARGATSE